MVFVPDGAGAPYTGISPPAGLAGCPLRLRRLTAHGGRFNARAETGQSYLPNMRIIASRPATACLCADGCSPYTSLLKAGSWPAHSRTAFLSDAYRTYPVDLFNYRTVASPHRSALTGAPVPIGGGVESPPHFEGCFREIVFSNKWILRSLCLFWGEKAGGSCQRIYA